MQDTTRSRRNPGRGHALLARVGSVAGCVSLILHGAAVAGESGPDGQVDASTSLGEIVVTANRRSESVAKAPYNISAYSSDQLKAANITTLTGLSQQVPNFVVQDSGARASESQVPIIRGLNASEPSAYGGNARYFQSPVGYYLGNSPMTGALPLMDLERVEVLRGPQGTLYGGGTLAGAVRVVPAEPKLYGFGAEAGIDGAIVGHSGSRDFNLDGMVNLPLGETVALRVVAKDQYEAGFIDQFNIMRRQGNNYANGVPLLADPADVASSRAIYFDSTDVNSTRTVATRASLLWKPTDEFKLVGTYNYAKISGNGSPTDDSGYVGGPSPIDPRITLPATGEYRISSPSLEPFERKSGLATLDGSYDAGFATLSGTFSYGYTNGSNVLDGTRNIVGTPFQPYYTGDPANPRFASTVVNTDDEKTYTEELRLVSNGKHAIDYVLGAFFQQQKNQILYYTYNPGADVQSAAAHAGDTTPVYLGGTYIPLYSDNSVVRQPTVQKFRDYSLYGNLTWNVSDAWQVTGGARIFHETFNEQRSLDLALNQTSSVYPNNSNSLTRAIFMANSSYQLAPAVKIYATWSQGFRRGGTSSIPITGPFAEAPQLVNYNPDKVDNFELGVKGTAGGLYLSAAVFYILWDGPQIDTQTPYLAYNVVINGRKASSRGLELEVSGPLGLKGLSFNAGLAYARARLTEDFTLPVGTGGGQYDPNGITGKAGNRLPGAPDFSGTVNIKYGMPVFQRAMLTFNLGADFRSSTINDLADINSATLVSTVPGYWLLRGNVEMTVGHWRAALYGTNLTDKYVVYAKSLVTTQSLAAVGTYAGLNTVARPRVIGLQLSRDW